MDKIMNFLYWWNENIYLLKIIESFDNGLYSIILVMFILFLYPIPWAIVITWIAQLKISYIFRFSIILSLTLLIAIADLLMIIVYAPFIVFHLILYRKEKITKRMLLISIALIMLTQIKIPFDYYTYYLKCNHNEFYKIELIDNELSIKELEWDKNSKNNTFPIYSEYDKSKSSLFGLKHYNLHLVKDDRVIAKKIVPVVVNGWLDRMLGNFFGNHFENRKYCYMNNYNQKLITKLKELISEKNNNKIKQSI